MQCPCSAHAVPTQCPRSAHAVQMWCTCSAHAVQMWCTCAVHMQCTCRRAHAPPPHHPRHTREHLCADAVRRSRPASEQPLNVPSPSALAFAPHAHCPAWTCEPRGARQWRQLPARPADAAQGARGAPGLPIGAAGDVLGDLAAHDPRLQGEHGANVRGAGRRRAARGEGVPTLYCKGYRSPRRARGVCGVPVRVQLYTVYGFRARSSAESRAREQQ